MIVAVRRWAQILIFYCLMTPFANSQDEEGWQAFELRNGYIALPVTVNGVKGWAMLDTGAPSMSVNQTLVSNQQLQQTEQSTQGAFSTQRDVVASQVELELFGHKHRLRGIHAAPLGDFLLVIGRDFFGRHLLQIDYPHQRMRLLTRAAIPATKFGNIPARRSRFGVMVQVEVPDTGNAFWVDLDTGNNDGIVTSRRAAERNDLLTMPPVEHTHGQDINGAVARLDKHLIPALRLGPYELENIALFVEAEGERIKLGRGTQGSIGLAGRELFKHFLLTISFREAEVHLTVPSSH